MDDLIEKERGFWLKGGDHYDAHAAGDAVYVIAKEDGILRHDAAADVIGRAGVWDSVEFGEVVRQDLGGGIEVLTYPATGTRDGAVLRANCTTIYKDGTLVHHQQTPLTRD